MTDNIHTRDNIKWNHRRKVAPVQLDVKTLRKILEEIDTDEDTPERAQPAVTVVAEVRDDLDTHAHDHTNATTGEYEALPSLADTDTRHVAPEGPNSLKTERPEMFEGGDK